MLKKASEILLRSLYIFLLTLLALFAFWELYGKRHIEKYIDKNYGNYIERTYNNSELLKELLNDT